jgi:hypothetical protein
MVNGAEQAEKGQRQMTRRYAIALVALALAACSRAPTVIDGSSPEAFAKTTEKARRDLPIKDRLTFDAALRNTGGQRYADKDPEATAREAYNGMTAADVVADAHARGIE